MKVYAFPLGPDGLVNGPKKTLVDFGTKTAATACASTSRATSI